MQGGLVARPAGGRSRQAAQQVSALAEMIACGWGSAAPAFREVFSWLLMPEAPAEQVLALTDLEVRSATPAVSLRLWLAFNEVDIADLAPRIRVPTLVLHSRGDALVPFEEGRRMATLVPGAEFQVLENRNHILQPAEPAWRVL